MRRRSPHGLPHRRGPPVPRHVRVATLDCDLPTGELFGRKVAPLDRWWLDPAGVQSTLRLCALMGLLLKLTPVSRAAGRQVLHLLSALELFRVRATGGNSHVRA